MDDSVPEAAPANIVAPGYICIEPSQDEPEGGERTTSNVDVVARRWEGPGLPEDRDDAGLYFGGLVLVGLVALVVVGGIGLLGHNGAIEATGVGLASVCALGALAAKRKAWARGRAVRRESRASARQMELRKHEETVSSQPHEGDIVPGPKWFKVEMPATHFDVFGGTRDERAALVVRHVSDLARNQPVLLLDVSQSGICTEVLQAVWSEETSTQEYHFPPVSSGPPLRTDFSDDGLLNLIVELTSGDSTAIVNQNILKGVGRCLGSRLSITRMHAALRLLLDEEPGDGILTDQEQDELVRHFSDRHRDQIGGNLVDLVATVEPLLPYDVGAAASPPARVTGLSVAGELRSVAADLHARLLVLWATSGVHWAGRHAAPAIVLVGADEQVPRDLDHLTRKCEEMKVPLYRFFGPLTQANARYMDRCSVFLPPRSLAEAVLMADAIGMRKKFIPTSFATTTAVNQARTNSMGAFSLTASRNEGKHSTTSRVHERLVEPEELMELFSGSTLLYPYLMEAHLVNGWLSGDPADRVPGRLVTGTINPHGDLDAVQTIALDMSLAYGPALPGVRVNGGYVPLPRGGQ